MIRLGLTGSIGMGKSETARMFARLGILVFDADETVHALYAKGGAAVGPIGAAFPDAVDDGAVDRDRLGRAVIGKPGELIRLEAIVHPLVRAAEQRFLEDAARAGADIVVLDIPLLYEKGGEGRCDRVVVVSAPADVQRERVLARPGMTREKFDAILATQLDDAEKRRRADYVIMTDKGLDDAFAQVGAVVDSLRGEMAGR
jgi:dephospho-CoA kinase